MMDYYSALKEKSYQDKKKLRKLRWILLSAKKQYCMISVILHSGKGKTMDRTTTRNQ